MPTTTRYMRDRNASVHTAPCLELQGGHWTEGWGKRISSLQSWEERAGRIGRDMVIRSMQERGK
eukprot:763917-Hanusia_phi.AAC.3